MGIIIFYQSFLPDEYEYKYEYTQRWFTYKHTHHSLDDTLYKHSSYFEITHPLNI